MKKYLLLCSALTIVSSVQAADINCATPPSCEELGFVMTEIDCEGQFSLKCPFDDNLLFCEKEMSNCKVGSILYNDLKCYDTAPSDKTAIAVVFDATNKLAIGLNDAPGSGVSTSMTWSSSSSDISGLTNYTTSSAALAETTTGKQNTATIVALGGNYASSSYAPGYCYNLTTGGQAKGSWFLPNLKELKAIYNNLGTINTAINRTETGQIFVLDFYWSSAETSSLEAWKLFMDTDFGTLASSAKTDNVYVRCGIAF